MSLARRMKRRVARLNPEREKAVNPQPTVLFKDGSYKTLHPTKGWRRVSAARVRLYGG